jgi:hypothetical protein
MRVAPELDLLLDWGALLSRSQQRAVRVEAAQAEITAQRLEKKQKEVREKEATLPLHEPTVVLDSASSDNQRSADEGSDEVRSEEARFSLGLHDSAFSQYATAMLDVLNDLEDAFAAPTELPVMLSQVFSSNNQTPDARRSEAGLGTLTEMDLGAPEPLPQLRDGRRYSSDDTKCELP